jgi:hypothetical protein
MAHLGRHLPSEHHVEFRKAEDKHIVLVDEPDLDGIAEGVRKNRRQLEAAETDPEHHDSRFHVFLLPQMGRIGCLETDYAGEHALILGTSAFFTI